MVGQEGGPVILPLLHVREMVIAQIVRMCGVFTATAMEAARSSCVYYVPILIRALGHRKQLRTNGKQGIRHKLRAVSVVISFNLVSFTSKLVLLRVPPQHRLHD